MSILDQKALTTFALCSEQRKPNPSVTSGTIDCCDAVSTQATMSAGPVLTPTVQGGSESPPSIVRTEQRLNLHGSSCEFERWPVLR